MPANVRFLAVIFPKSIAMHLILRGVLFFGLICIFSFHGNEKPTDALNHITELPRYYLEQGWPQLSFGYQLSQPSGIGIDTSQNIFVFNRTGRTWEEPFPDTLISRDAILMLDRQSGKILKSWGSNLFIMPHGLTVDRQNNVWVTDVSLQEVFKFSHEGAASHEDRYHPGNGQRFPEV